MAKVLTVGNRKGGVGKTFCTVQLAYRANIEHGLRVLVIDMDDQRNCGDALSIGGKATISDVKTSELFTKPIALPSPAPFTVITADSDKLRTLNTQGAEHNSYASNLKRNVITMGEQFDLILIDVPPAADIRQLSALIASTHTVIPVVLSKESISGIGQMLNDPMIGLNNIKAKLNPSLELLGVVVNMVSKASRFQTDAFDLLVKNYHSLLIAKPKTPKELTDDAAKSPNSKVMPAFCWIPQSTVFLESQAQGTPATDMRSRSPDALDNLTGVCDQLLINMQVISEATAV